MIRIYSFITQQRAVRIEPAALFIYDFLFGYMLNVNIQGVFMTGKMHSETTS